MEMKDTSLRVVEAWLNQWAARLDESQARIDGVKASMAALETDARANYGEHLLVLQDKIDRARAKLEEGRVQVETLAPGGGPSATDSVWETFKAGAEAVWEDLKQALDQTDVKPVQPTDQSAQAGLEPMDDSGRKGGPA